MNDDQTKRNWWALDEDQLRGYAAEHIGASTDEMSDPADLAWTLERLPASEFNAVQVDWLRYQREEVEENPRYDEAFARAEHHTPIVISLENGEPIIWDGWRRISCVMRREDDDVLAIVGRPRRD